MSGQSALRERAALLNELHQIVQAMKNVAFAEVQRVTHMQPAQTLACDALLGALDALPGEAPPSDSADRACAPACWLVIGAERGFCGAFNTRLAEAVVALRGEEPQVRLLVASRRLYELLGPAAGNAVLLPGCATLEDADAALDEWISALAREAPRCREFWLLHASETGMTRLRLLPEPLPSNRKACTASPLAHGDPPMRYLPLPALRTALLHQAVRLLVQRALCASLKQENRWRLSQMQRAQDHLDELGQLLRRRYAALRQADITNEQETLMSSVQGPDATGSQSPLASAGK